MNILLGQLDKIIIIFCLFIAAFSVRTILLLIGQRWVVTFTQTATLCTLPIITYVISTIISGNIALSLGMVGALSIVRFRHPVKSPFELAVYFLAITMGIAASVAIHWLGILFVSVLGVLITLKSLNYISRNFFGYEMFEISFSEGNDMLLLELESSEELAGLELNANLISLQRDEKSFRYGLNFNKRVELMKVAETYSNHPSIIKSNLRL